MKSSQEILTELLAHLKISANKLAYEIGLTANTSIYHVKNGRNKISPDLAKKIVDRYPEVNYNWLLTGEGEITQKHYNENHANDEPEKYEIQDLRSMHQDIKGDINDLKQELHALAKGSTKNQEVISKGIFQTLKDLQKVVRFVDKIDPGKISQVSAGLEQFLKEHK